MKHLVILLPFVAWMASFPQFSGDGNVSVANVAEEATSHAPSGDCEYLVNEVDDFSGAIKRETQAKIYERNVYEEVLLHLYRENNSFKIQVHHFNSTQRLADPASFVSSADNSLMIKLATGEILKFQPIEPVTYSRQEQASAASELLFGAYSALSRRNKMIFEPTYHLSADQLRQLSSTQIAKVRVECSGTNTYTGRQVENIDVEVGSEEAAAFQQVAKCLME